MSLQFLLGTKDIKNLQKIREYAEKNTFPLSKVLDIIAGKDLAAGDRHGYDCMLPLGIKVVFSYEEQKQGMTRHLSVSKADGRIHPVAIGMIMKELGFKNRLEDCAKWVEQDKAVNVLEFTDQTIHDKVINNHKN